MALIVPTITTEDQAELDDRLKKFLEFTKRIQIDTSDGTFAPTSMVPVANIKAPDEAKIDLHLMTARPSQYFDNIVALKPNLCILHAEINDDLPNLIKKLKEAGIKVGLALLKGTFPKRVEELILNVDHVMIFAGNLGSQGGNIDLLQIEKVPLIRAIKPNVEIGWDGGANLSNVRMLAHAGIDVINVGSAITKAADSGAMYQSLVAECEKKGVLV